MTPTNEPPPNFALADDPAFAKAPITREQLAAWSQRYGRGATGGRQIRRWIDDGLKAGDPCPINDPARLAQWWSRRMKWRCPDAILRAAADSPSVSISPAAPDSAPVPPAVAVPSPVALAEPITLADYQLAEGEVVQQQRRIVAALYKQLEASYLHGRGDTDILQSKYNKACEALRRLEKDDREDQRHRGLLIPRASVQRDADAAAELLRQMSESETRRVMELCPSLGNIQREEVTSAIARVAQARIRVLRNLRSLKSESDVLVEFAAA